MSPLISYRTDDEEREFRRKVDREMARLQRNRRRRREPLWKLCLSRVIVAAALWVVGEAALYVHGQIHLTMPASQPVPHFTSTPNPNGGH